MSSLMKAFTAVLFLVIIAGAQKIQNVQFSDLEGNSYDLYTILEEGKHILCHFSRSG